MAASKTEAVTPANGTDTGLEIDMVKAKETKGTFMYEEEGSDGGSQPDGRRSMNIYISKAVLKSAFGGAAPEKLLMSITSRD